MKYLLVIVVVGVLLWLMLGRRTRIESKARENVPAGPVEMLACSHCGVHLPRTDALFDGAGRPYCGEAHRLAGPR